MPPWTQLTALGLRAAAMSGIAEGDCALNAANATTRGAFLHGLGLEPSTLVCPRQTHGVVVVTAGVGDAGKGAVGPECSIADADAIITNTPGLPIGISVADCVPVALYDPVRGAIGLAHAGREGTVRQIARESVLAMARDFGSEASNMRAVIGPSAGPCCYEVSEELATTFAAAGGPVQGQYLDLWEANGRQLRRVGVPAEQISVARICTICGRGFHSYRRDKTAARNLVVLCL